MVDVTIIDVTIHLARQVAESLGSYEKKVETEEQIGLISSRDDSYETYDYRLYKENERALQAYLNALTFEDIKDLQTIMYLGRGDAGEDGSGQQRYRDLEKEFRERWSTKEVEINQMCLKRPLSEYLERGKKALHF